MASKTLARATRPDFYELVPKIGICTRKIIMLTDSYTVGELNRNIIKNVSASKYANTYRTIEG